jgi:hypothetical protein
MKKIISYLLVLTFTLPSFGFVLETEKAVLEWIPESQDLINNEVEMPGLLISKNAHNDPRRFTKYLANYKPKIIKNKLSEMRGVLLCEDLSSSNERDYCQNVLKKIDELNSLKNSKSELIKQIDDGDEFATLIGAFVTVQDMDLEDNTTYENVVQKQYDERSCMAQYYKFSEKKPWTLYASFGLLGGGGVTLLAVASATPIVGQAVLAMMLSGLYFGTRIKEGNTYEKVIGMLEFAKEYTETGIVLAKSNPVGMRNIKRLRDRTNIPDLEEVSNQFLELQKSGELCRAFGRPARHTELHKLLK